MKGVAPAPTSAELTIGNAAVKLNYDATTGALRYDATTSKMAPSDRVLALTLQRSEGDKPGPIIAQLLAPNQIIGSGTVVLKGRNREDFAAGRIYLHFYTRQMPLGFERQRLTLR